MSVLKLINVNKFYENGNQPLHVLKDINLSVDEGEFVAIVGPSGSGKSTILNVIGGLDGYDSGEVIVDGREYKSQSDEIMSDYRRKKIGFVFQDFNLIPVLNVYENVIFPIQIDGKIVDEQRIDNILKELGIFDKKNQYPMKLSGGQKQRVAIARALSNLPKLVLADEPTGNLDSETGQKVLELLVSGVRKYGQTLVMITHNEEIAKKAERIYYMKDGILYD